MSSRKRKRESLIPEAPLVYRGEGPLICSVARNKHGVYCIPKSAAHCGSVRIVAKGSVYEPKTIAFVAKHCGDSDVVHAGTFFGDFLPALSKALAPGRKLWAFEPNLESFRCAEITIKLNGLENVCLYHAALGAYCSEVTLVSTYQGRAAGGGSFVAQDGKQRDPNRLQRVPTISLDSAIVDRHVSVLQLDTQFYEQPILQGALNLVARCKPILVLEVVRESILVKTPWFRDNILSLGYRFDRKLHNNYVYVPEDQ